jgi:AraC-like DNA-binding protein
MGLLIHQYLTQRRMERAKVLTIEISPVEGKKHSTLLGGVIKLLNVTTFKHSSF